MVQETDLVRAEIDETREHLTEKLVTLEERLRDRLENAKTQADETIENVRGVVRSFSPRYQIENNPLTAVGLSVGAGVVTAALVSRRAERRELHRQFPELPPATPPGRVTPFYAPTESHAVPEARPRKEEGPSLWHRFSTYFEDELQLVKGLVAAAAAEKLASMVKQPMPGIASEVDEIVRSVKRKAGFADVGGPGREAGFSEEERQ